MSELVMKELFEESRAIRKQNERLIRALERIAGSSPARFGTYWGLNLKNQRIAREAITEYRKGAAAI